MGEIIRIEVTDVDGRSVRYVDIVNRVSGVADSGGRDLPVGAELVVEIDRSRTTPAIVRVVGEKPVEPEPVSDPAADADLLVDGKPFDPDPTDEAARIRVGQVRTAEVRFNSGRTADRDKGESSKRRPCVIAGIEGDFVIVMPIHGANSAVRRGGRGRRLEGWRELGMRKSSYVSAERIWVEREVVGDLIGALGDQDMRRLDLDD